MKLNPTLVRFRHDLCLADNPALASVAERGGPLVPVFIWSPEEEESWPPGGALRCWLHQSLASLDANLCATGSRWKPLGESSEGVLGKAPELPVPRPC